MRHFRKSLRCFASWVSISVLAPSTTRLCVSIVLTKCARPTGLSELSEKGSTAGQNKKLRGLKKRAELGLGPRKRTPPKRIQPKPSSTCLNSSRTARQATPACARDRSAAKPSRLQDRLAGAFPVRNEGGQTLVGQRMLVECRQHLWRQGDDIGTEKGGVDDMLRSADRGDENLCRKIILVVDGADLLDQPHAVGRDVGDTGMRFDITLVNGLRGILALDDDVGFLERCVRIAESKFGP